jgi:hypothetical protein
MKIQFGTCYDEPRILIKDVSCTNQNIGMEKAMLKIYPDGCMEHLPDIGMHQLQKVKFEMSCEEFMDVVSEVFKTLGESNG